MTKRRNPSVRVKRHWRRSHMVKAHRVKGFRVKAYSRSR